MSILSSTSGLSSLANTSGSLSVSGLISGIDTSKVIQGLLAIEQQKIDNIGKRQTAIQIQQAAFKGIEAKLLAFQDQIKQLARPVNGVFDAHTVQVSNADLLAAAASSSAVAGDYNLRINSLARADQIAAQGFDSLTSAVTHGAFSLTVGATTTELTVDGTNDTLQGFADAINASGAAVFATIVNDGSGDNQQCYRLILTSKATGTANRISITNGLADTTAEAVKPLFDSGSISNAIPAAGNTGTSTIQSNAGAGFTGDANNSYQFTVTQGGTVGTDDGIVISYTDSSGANTGTITVDSGDADVLKQVAQGIGVQFAAGTLVAGDTFVVKAFVPTVQAAADASISIGSGSGAFTVTSSSNKVDSFIPGVSLSLKSSDPNKDITLTVSHDTDGITKAIQGFVSTYNDVIGYIDQQTAFDSATGQAGPLLGNVQVLTIQQQVRSAIQNVVPGANSQLSYLGALGITPTNNGQLVLDNAKLSSILAGNKPGVTIGDVRKLFALTGASTNPGIQFIAASAKTRASATPYTVQITQAADKASLTATNALAVSTVIDNTNDTLVVSVDGTTSSAITLAPGAYTRSEFAQMLQGAINNNATLAARDVTVGVLVDKLTVTSNIYGTASRVGMESGNALAALGFAGGETAQGLNVAGYYLVDSVTEPAHGSGPFLIGDAGNENTDDLQVRVTLTPAQVGAGAQGDLTVSRGLASNLDILLTNLFDPVNGRLNSIDDGYAAAIERLEADKAKIVAFMTTRQLQLEKQFNAMEQILSQLQSASNILAQQAASLTQKK